MGPKQGTMVTLHHVTTLTETGHLNDQPTKLLQPQRIQIIISADHKSVIHDLPIQLDDQLINNSAWGMLLHLYIRQDTSNYI